MLDNTSALMTEPTFRSAILSGGIQYYLSITSTIETRPINFAQDKKGYLAACNVYPHR